MSFALLLVVAALLAGCPAFAERLPYDHYRSIVDRQMFGPLPADFDPSKMPSEAKASQKRGKQAESLTKEQEKLKSAVHFSVINVTPGGAVKVGFTDRSDSKSPRNYYLGVGESRDGWVVKEADPDTATMTIEKGEIEITLTIGGDSSKSDKATKKAGAATPAATAAPAAAKPRSTLLGGLRNRTRLSRKEERQQTAEEIAALKKRNEELQKAQAADAARREAEKAEQDAKREEDQKNLKSLQSELESVRQKIQEQRQAEPLADERQEEGNDENDNS